MKTKYLFELSYSEDYLKKIYAEKIILSGAIGLDNIGHKDFWPQLKNNLKIISNKASNCRYEFTKYKLKLVSKGRGKAPREISIPTIRDRIALRALCDFLLEKYQPHISLKLPQEIIREVKRELISEKYDSFIKLDVENFYPSINHDKLRKNLGRRIKDKRAISIVDAAIKTPTVAKPTKSDKKSEIGVPQGLSISNILASIYLINIDKRYSGDQPFKYFRYVDDILILCHAESAQTICNDAIKRFRKIGLTVHPPLAGSEKSIVGKIQTESLSYLGYRFINKSLITPRNSSVDKLMESLVSVFTSYKHSKEKSIEFLEWRLNLRTTGCIFKKKCKGWLFFFSEINDENMLHELDHFVERLKRRFGVEVNQKKFVRAFFQISHKKYESKYIPNFDTYKIDDMRFVLTHYFKQVTAFMTNDEIIYAFRKKIDRQVKDLETDIQDFGY